MYFFLLFHLVQSDTVLLFFGATVTTRFPQGLIKSSESEHVNNTLSEQIVIEVRVWIMLPHVWMWNHNQRYKVIVCHNFLKNKQKKPIFI